MAQNRVRQCKRSSARVTVTDKKNTKYNRVRIAETPKELREHL